ncbi:type I-E CRISPR-associated endonuclease Cas1e [Jatrophihabitans lederbergiae]|uniref:CRISPR-associated endonuclease Cas1 n=1 Tax=Jatrophihabitans lederbergiae TaxID=3075547 RepID=A0ABU2JFM0_9ACTN|nr:type I-E CRISPR-associated endonuclease Cas1e [Jatrophihabitans sp. DSM 44399]MDT0263789.1 type I-E CRISPR-associated endonuclease Cas1e [Jatrophihabitans sp. DSM 44399]
MWWATGVTDLARVQSRVSTLYLDKCSIDRTRNSITVDTARGTLRIPAALIGTLLLGPGVTVTHGAMVLLANSGTAVCWVGQNAVRFYAGGTSTSATARVALRQAWLVSRPRERLAVARAMYALRFPGENVDELTMQQLLGREGSRVRALYAQHSRRTGVPWTGRAYIAGNAMAAGDDVNRLLSAANTALYGASHAAVLGVGAVPSLGFVHSGAANSFVLDIADIYKHETTIPLAFDLASAGQLSERAARLAFRDLVVELRLMERIANDVLALLGNPTRDDSASVGLWDGRDVVAAGVNYAEDMGSVVDPDFAAAPHSAPADTEQ